MIFRFDDVCINADLELIRWMTQTMVERFPDCRIIYGVSPLVHDMSGANSEVEKQRVFPKILNAHSDHRKFYEVNYAGVPDGLHPRAELAGHGLIHVDHRLLTKEMQELSILVSASLVDSKIFIPPFNKWNDHTQEICDEHGIELVKFEDGWLSMEYNARKEGHKLWYLHAREWTIERLSKWLTI